MTDKQLYESYKRTQKTYQAKYAGKAITMTDGRQRSLPSTPVITATTKQGIRAQMKKQLNEMRFNMKMMKQGKAIERQAAVLDRWENYVGENMEMIDTAIDERAWKPDRKRQLDNDRNRVFAEYQSLSRPARFRGGKLLSSTSLAEDLRKLTENAIFPSDSSIRQANFWKFTRQLGILEQISLSLAKAMEQLANDMNDFTDGFDEGYYYEEEV